MRLQQKSFFTAAMPPALVVPPLNTLPHHTNTPHTMRSQNAQHRLLTLNVEHLGLKLISGDWQALRHASTITQWCNANKINLANTQETTPNVVRCFQKAGYKALDADHLQPRFSFRWRGLASYFDPADYTTHTQFSPQFAPYSQANQKSWQQVRDAATTLLGYLLRCPQSNQIQQKTIDFICSLSGVLRQDGLLITPLKSTTSNDDIVLCNTHLESFDVKIRDQQTQEMITKINVLRVQHPQATFFVSGDFNRPAVSCEYQRQFHEGLNDIMARSFNAKTIPDHGIVPTHHDGHCIDGIYVIDTLTTVAAHAKTTLNREQNTKDKAITGAVCNINDPYNHAPVSDHNGVTLSM